MGLQSLGASQFNPIHHHAVFTVLVLALLLGLLTLLGVFKTRNGEMAKCETAKWRNDEMAKWQYISVFQKGKRNVCLKCPKFAKTEFQNPIEACTKTLHSGYIVK